MNKTFEMTIIWYQIASKDDAVKVFILIMRAPKDSLLR
jgi:hypothetical protein